jgi:hypothetical protein
MPWTMVLLAATGLFGCNGQTCQPKYTPGDQFKITINGSLSGDTPCDIMPLHAGDSFVLTVGAILETDQNGCPEFYAGQPQVPGYTKGVLSTCPPVESPRALSCCGMLHGCQVCLHSELGALPSGSKQVIEHATLTSSVSSTLEDWGALDGGTCLLPADCFWDEYDVTIEKLANGANN